MRVNVLIDVMLLGVMFLHKLLDSQAQQERKPLPCWSEKTEKLHWYGNLVGETALVSFWPNEEQHPQLYSFM